MSGLLRLCTAGSVDDGKSTLIGRLLYDSRAVYDDHVRAVEQASHNRTAGPIDFSLFTDGLKAEREQGITIDVAYRYFATRTRKFILADTPGHEQYTRNMATGASTADLAVVVVDARRGLWPQTRRHAAIARLFGISTFVLAVNKMDLVDFDRAAFDAIRREFGSGLENAMLHAVPISALFGDNVMFQSRRTPWFEGPSLVRFLETVPIDGCDPSAQPLRLPVQLVLRSAEGFRGYAGRIHSGGIRPGDAVSVWPSGVVARVTRIVTWSGDLAVARAPMSIAVTLDRDVEIGRGDVIAAAGEPPHVTNRFDARIVWMDERALEPSRVYLLKCGTRTVTAEVSQPLGLNEIGTVTVSTAKRLAFDRYRDNRATGSFIIIDPATNFTAGAGMILEPLVEPTRVRHQGAARRLARIARTALTDEAAEDAIRHALEQMLV